MNICIIDTSIFVELLDVPLMAPMHVLVVDELARKVAAGDRLLLPMTTIIETGNHIGQNGDGTMRRATALRFLEKVNEAIAGTSPFTTTAFFDKAGLEPMLAAFPDWTQRTVDGKGSGFGDLTIYTEFERWCKAMPAARVYIWSLDGQLASYDRVP